MDFFFYLLTGMLFGPSRSVHTLITDSLIPFQKLLSDKIFLIGCDPLAHSFVISLRLARRHIYPQTISSIIYTNLPKSSLPDEFETCDRCNCESI